MLAADHIAPTQKAEITTRLKTIEGQARGIQRMLADDRDCQTILDQLTALRAATHAVTMEALTAFGSQCLREAGAEQEQVIQQIFAIVSRLTR